MRAKRAIGLATLLGFATTLSMGCGGADNVPLAKVPEVQPAPSKPVPQDKKLGGGQGSSGNSKMNPGASS
jgi:hypothetical protein